MDKQKLIKRRKKALQEKNDSALISVCTDLANLYMDEGSFDSAIKEYSTIANYYQKAKNVLDFARANRGIGEAYLGQQNFEKALEYQKLYLDGAKEGNDKLEEQRALATIGHTYLSSYLDHVEPNEKNLDLANKFFQRSLIASQILIGQIGKTELAEMSARLFSNLGVVQDCKGNWKQAFELITKSINLCKSHDLYEQLQRGYASMASLLMKKGDFQPAILQYNSAIEIAKKLRSKPNLLAGILLSKSEVLIKLGDLHAAKSALLKAYKLKIPDKQDRKNIENNLRAVVSMCNTEDKLLIADSTDHATLKVLYEKMGDDASDLKQFDKALDYYKKMLDSAIKAEMPDSQLATCYYSIAEAYSDNRQYNEAVVYFEKELDLCPALKDNLNTLSKIADVKETANYDVAEVQAVYEGAISLCRKEGDKHEEGRMVNRLIMYLRRQKQHSRAFKFEQLFEKLNYQSSDTEDDSSKGQSDGDKEKMDLSALTDISDDSDIEQPSTSRRRSKAFQIRKNIKGETQLHTACIKGQLNVVRHLLEQGHPVNVRDNAGWLPLHEACIHGHLEVVRMLVDKGATVNDRGGKDCLGTTPMHDAASNGHLLIIQFLLSKGGNAVAKTDSGETVLEYLKVWRSKNQLDEDAIRLYESLIEQLSQALDKAGHVVMKCNRICDDSQSAQTSDLTTPTKDNRRSALIGLTDDDSMSPSTRAFKPRNTTSEYKDVMENLRHRNPPVSNTISPQYATVAKRPALVSAEEAVDDWLEDDMGKCAKRRKTCSPVKSQSSRNSISSPAKSVSARRSREGFGSSEDFEMWVEDDYENRNNDVGHSRLKTSPASIASSGSRNSSLGSKSRKKQMKLTHLGHTRTVVEADSTSSSRRSSFYACETNLNKILPRANSVEQCQTQPVIEPTLSIDVRISSKLYRVPILLSQVHSLTIKWLAEEAAFRYARKEYVVPVLELETKNGAILADDDPISLLFPMGTTQAEEVEGRIVKWNVPPIEERYKEACQNMSIDPHDELCQSLQELSVSLDLCNRGLKAATLAPLCKVLNRQTNLIELGLSGNFLNKDCFQFLGTSLTSLENLHKLNLNCTGLQSEDLLILINSLPPDTVYKLNELNLSDNYLGDESFVHLATLTRRFHLKVLNLSGNKFTKNAYNHCLIHQLNLGEIEEFDVSDNYLENAALIQVLSWLNFGKLVSLNLSRNSVSEGFMQQVINLWTDARRLKVCKLSRCHVQDSDLFDLLRLSISLESLDVSYNNDLTSVSLRRLFQSDIESIDLYGCPHIFGYFSEFSLRSTKLSRTIKLMSPENCYEEVEYLIQSWRDLYGNRSSVERTARFLCLSI